MPSQPRPAGLKWNYYPSDVHAAWVAEMDFGLAPSIRAALHEAVDRDDTGYPYPAAEIAVAETASRFWKGRFGWDVEPGQVFHAPDVIEGIRRAIAHLTRPGSPVVLHTPVYFPFFSMVERAGREIIEVPSPKEADGRYHLDMAGIDAALSAGAGSIVLCNPWNPVGRSLHREEIDEVLDLAATHDARVITDEVHAALTFDGKEHVTAASIDPERVITVTAASKAWNIPGLKAAQVVLTSERDREVWEPYFTPEKVGVSTFGLLAAAAAYDGGVEWLDEVMTTLHTRRDQLGDLMARLPQVGYTPPEATYLAWLDFRDLGWADPAAHCLEQARVAVTEGSQFRGDGAGHVRLNFATSPEVLRETIERIASVC